MLPRVPGIPWWAATALAVAFTALGVAYDAAGGGQSLGTVFTVCYVLGCVLAVLAVRQSGVFTAVIQPPLILFVAVPFAYFVFHGSTFTGIKDTLINCGYPLIERFPLMFFAAATVLLIGMIRWYLGAAARRGAPADADPVVAEAAADSRQAAAATSALGAAAGTPRRARRSTTERTSRAKAAPIEDAVDDEVPAARPPRRSAATSSRASGAAPGSSRSRHSLPSDEIGEPPPGRPRRRNAPPVDPPAEPRRRARSADPRDAREPREPREPRERESRTSRERRPLPPLDRRSAYDRPERADRPERSDRPQRRERQDPLEQRPLRSDRPQRRPRSADYEPYEAHEAPPRRPSGDGGSHHPVSRVRYRGTDDDGERRTEHRTRPRRSRHSAPESWEYDA